MISALKLLTPTCALVKSQVYPKWCFSSNLWYPRFGIPISGTSSQKILIKLLWVREFDHFFLQETTMITRFLLDRSYLATTIHGFNRRFSLQHSSTNPTFPEVTVDMSFHTQLGLDVDWANGKSLYVRHLQGSGAVEEWNRQHLGACVERWSFGHDNLTFRALFLVQLGFWKMLLIFVNAISIFVPFLLDPWTHLSLGQNCPWATRAALIMAGFFQVDHE